MLEMQSNSHEEVSSDDSWARETCATPATGRAYFKRHEMVLQTLLKSEKPHSVCKTVQYNSDTFETKAFDIPVDYEDAWEAVAAVIDKKGLNWQRELRLKEQKEINREYDQARAAAFFNMQRDKEAGTKLLDDLTSDNRTLRRTRSDPTLGEAVKSTKKSMENDAMNTVIVNTGVNWVCPQNPNNNGLNATCLQPSAKSALTHIKPADCGANFNVQANCVTRRTEVLREKVEDKMGRLHDERKIYFLEESSGKTISPWHDISLICHSPPEHITKSHGLLVNMVVEIPRFNSAKMEISTTRTHNPIIQDRCKKMNLQRYYAGPIPWNYGALPQTWEDPEHAGDGEVKNALGDGDPLDIVDVGRSPSKEFMVGEVVPVRVLGCLPMLDGGDELDWKVLAINCYDNNFDSIHDLYSLEQIYPHTLTGVREWFRWYKFNDSKSTLNDFGYMGLVLCRCGAESIIENTHLQWRRLIKKTHKMAQQILKKEEREAEINGKCDPKLRNKEVEVPKTSVVDFGEHFNHTVWVPGKLRPKTKAWNDRHLIWQGYLAKNAGRDNRSSRSFSISSNQNTPFRASISDIKSASGIYPRQRASSTLPMPSIYQAN